MEGVIEGFWKFIAGYVTNEGMLEDEFDHSTEGKRFRFQFVELLTHVTLSFPSLVKSEPLEYIRAPDQLSPIPWTSIFCRD